MNDKLDRQELLDQANALGLEFPPNIKTPKLIDMINEVKSPEAETEVETEQEPVEDYKAAIDRRHKEAMKTRVVVITNKDTRESDMVTTARLSFENQYYGLSKVVPLDIAVELEQALIDVAETTMITLHKDQIVDGKRTGNSVPVRVKKYAVSYQDNAPT